MSYILEKSLSQGCAVTYFRWGGQIYTLLVYYFLKTLYTKNYWDRFTFDRVILKNKEVAFFLRHSVVWGCWIGWVHSDTSVTNVTLLNLSLYNLLVWSCTLCY